MQPPLARSLVAELIGTFALVFAGAGAIMVDAQTHALGHIGVAISFGLVIMVMIYAVGHISGAHFNPAVSFAFALTRHFPWPRAISYWIAQATGAVIAAALLRGSLGNIAHVGATLPSGSERQSFLLGSRADLLPDVRDHGGRNRHPRRRRGSGDRDRRHGRPRCDVRRADLGASMNPARSFGPALVSGDLHALWLYIAAPLLGAGIGALAYQFVRGEGAQAAELPPSDQQARLHDERACSSASRTAAGR